MSLTRLLKWPRKAWSAFVNLPKKCASSTARGVLTALMALVVAMVAGAIMAVVTMRCGMTTTCTANAVVGTAEDAICKTMGRSSAAPFNDAKIFRKWQKE